MGGKGCSASTPGQHLERQQCCPCRHDKCVQAGHGQAGHDSSKGTMLNTRNADHRNGHGLCGDMVVGEDLHMELPGDPSWAKEQLPMVMGSKARAA